MSWVPVPDSSVLFLNRLPTPSLQDVTRAMTLYAARALLGQDSSRIEQFITRTARLGYLPADCPSFQSLIDAAKEGLLFAVILNSAHLCTPFPYSPSLASWIMKAGPSLPSPH